MTDIAGKDLAKEGAAMLPVLYPDASTHADAAKRLEARYRPLLVADEPHSRAVGFFLFGLAEAAAGRAIDA